ncbi:hypothetical protein ACIPSA_14360 [Streptomyces sp. NPDC086549]|uniref:hypothetical protein n=1 Tax=Streptomyces sp. NPDC086549 TaxID=3365752 RepID=UPI0038220B4E
MHAYVKMSATGAVKEYDFLGGEPAESWWLTFADLVDWNNQGLCVRSGGDGRWSLYLSPVHSGRLDPRGRHALFKLALVGSCDERETTSVALPLVELWLREVVGGAPTTRLRRAFSEAFPDEVVGRLQGRHGPDDVREKERRFAQAVNRLELDPYSPSVEERPGPSTAGSDLWWGVQDQEKDRRHFLDRVSRLLAGTGEGVAVLGDLVFAADVADDSALSDAVRRLTRDGHEVSLLVCPGDVPARAGDVLPGAFPVSPESPVMPGKAPAPTGTPTRSGRDAERYLRRAGLGCAALILVAVVLLILVVVEVL